MDQRTELAGHQPLFQQLQAASPRHCLDDPLASPDEDQLAPVVQLVTDLVESADRIPRYERPVYYSARRNPTTPAPLTLAQLKVAFAQEIARLARSGYFDDAFGSSCVDADEDPDAEGQRHLSGLLGLTIPLWPLARPDQTPTGFELDWPEDTFYDLIEALHDLTARPRRRSWHDFGREWDYQDFAWEPTAAGWSTRRATTATSSFGEPFRVRLPESATTSDTRSRCSVAARRPRPNGARPW